MQIYYGLGMLSPKYVVVKALKSKTKDGVIRELQDIYLELGLSEYYDKQIFMVLLVEISEYYDKQIFMVLLVEMLKCNATVQLLDDLMEG